MFGKFERLRKDIEHLERRWLKMETTIDKLCRDVHELQKTVNGSSHDAIEEAILFFSGEKGLKDKVHDIAVRQRAMEEYFRISPREVPATPSYTKMEPWPEPLQKGESDDNRTDG